MRFDEKLAKLKAIFSEESTFPDAAEEVVEQLNALAGGRLTDEMLAYFRMLGMSRNERVLLGNIQFLGAEWMIKENTDAVPACTVLPYGFFCPLQRHSSFWNVHLRQDSPSTIFCKIGGFVNDRQCDHSDFLFSAFRI